MNKKLMLVDLARFYYCQGWFTPKKTVWISCWKAMLTLYLENTPVIPKDWYIPSIGVQELMLRMGSQQAARVWASRKMRTFLSANYSSLVHLTLKGREDAAYQTLNASLSHFDSWFWLPVQLDWKIDISKASIWMCLRWYSLRQLDCRGLWANSSMSS